MSMCEINNLDNDKQYGWEIKLKKKRKKKLLKLMIYSYNISIIELFFRNYGISWDNDHGNN